MAELTVQEITKTMMTIIFAIEVFLIITHVPYVIFKLRYYLPPLLKYNRTALRFRYLAEFSRTCYLFMVTAFTGVKVFYAGIFQKNTVQWPCKRVFRVVGFYYYFVLNARILFAFARLVLFNLCVDKPFIKEKAGVIFTLSCFFVFLICVELNIQPLIEDDVCFTKLSIGVTLSVFVASLIYEGVSFTLYYRPLRGATIPEKHLSRRSSLLSADEYTTNEAGVSTKHLTMRCPHSHVLSTDDRPDGAILEEDPKSCHSVSVASRTSEKTKILSFNITDTHIDLLEKFRKIVRRNFWAGIVAIITCWSEYTLFLLFHCAESVSAGLHISSTIRASYWKSGVGEVLDKTLALIVYLAMMLSDNNWRRAFIPFFFWKREEWDV